MSIAGLLIHLGALGSANRKQLNVAASSCRFGELPRHIVSVQALSDQFRVVLLTMFWDVIILPWSAVVGVFLPPGLRVYACQTPLFDLGENVELGVAAHFAPRRSGDDIEGSSDCVPHHFVCSVSQLDGGCSRSGGFSGAADLRQHLREQRDAWGRAQETGAQGLVAGVSAIFPKVAHQGIA